jgi:DNA polymerase-1
MTNYPVQGSAAVVFKAAGNRLSRLYRRYDAWIVVPFHDAFIFEVPQNSLNEVAELTARVMRDTVQEYFPRLKPQVEINIGRFDCWNKDGKADAFEKWLEDPLYTV